jgi:hypothetical protein
MDGSLQVKNTFKPISSGPFMAHQLGTAPSNSFSYAIRGIGLPQVNTSAYAACQEHCTDELAALVEQRCARDIQQFGYTLDRN